jgi:hypothetical protein
VAQVVAPIASLRQGVGSEAQEGLGRHQLVEVGGVVARVDVVDDLRPLVADVAVLFEPSQPMHRT